LSRHRISGFSPWAGPFWSVNYLVGQTRRLAGNRRAWKGTLNFQISMLIYNVIAGILCLVLIGFVILGILHILNLVLVIVASIQASDGKFYRYPLTIRLIK
jgi:uncharacterized membrane protein